MSAAAWAFEGVLHLGVASWQAAAVAAVALGFSRLAPRAPSALRGGLLAIAAWKFCIPPMLPLPTGFFSRWDALPARGGLATAGGTLAIVCEILMLAHFAGWSARSAILAARHRRLRALRRRAGRVTAGPVADLARDACRRAGLSRLPEILVSAETAVPCAFGVRRPAICLPARLAGAMSREQLFLVLLHEALHLRRRDPLANAVEAWVTAFWWFHPAALLLARARRGIREERCDEEVLRACPKSEAPYSRALVAAAAFASRRPVESLVPAVADGPEHLRRRLLALARPRDARRGRLPALVFLPGVRPRGGGHPFSCHSGRSARR